MNTRFDVQTMALVLTWIGTSCWVVCFWWHPKVEEIKESVEDVSDKVSSQKP